MNKKLISWLRHNLFISTTHTILTLILAICICFVIPSTLNWLIFKANFVGNSPEACTSGGACWIFVRMRFNQFMYGFYPRDLQWRINLSYIIGILSIFTFVFVGKKYKKWCGLFLFVLFPCIAFILYSGNMFGLEEVDTYNWGGLHLTLVIAVTSIACSLPIGILLALCRNSHLFTARIISIIFIELWRGVPLISVLFMASVLIPMFFSQDMHIDKVLRALIGITLFFSAYMAEVIRDSLKATPKGQFEAANSLGFSYFHTMSFIILPQALKIAIPEIVNIFITLFKKTTLVSLIGLFDFLGMVQASNADPKWAAYGLEGYVFAAFVYWLFCFTMSRCSIHLEHKLNVGRKP